MNPKAHYVVYPMMLASDVIDKVKEEENSASKDIPLNCKFEMH